MLSKSFITTFSENYFSIKAKKLKRAKTTSLLIFLAVLFLVILNFYDFLKYYGFAPFYDDRFSFNLIKSAIYQFVILLGLMIRLIALRFDNRYALRFSELGTLIAFFSWLGLSVWSAFVHYETSKLADVNYSSHLVGVDGTIAVLMSFGFVCWLFYKIIFLIAIVWKTIRK